MLVGFARSSEYEPEAELAAQERALRAFGVEKVFTSRETLQPGRGCGDTVSCVRGMRETPDVRFTGSAGAATGLEA